MGSWFDEPRDPWRHEVEARCIASGRVRPSPTVQAVKEVDGPGGCGADSPFKVNAALLGTVWINDPVLMNCPMVAAVDDWLNEIVQPNAMALFGMPVAELRTFGTYSCRRIDNRTVGSMSEHAYLNAIDISAFRLEDGRWITVKTDWRTKEPNIRAFLHTVGAQSCKIFTTVIGPDGDGYHQDHLHLDLANRRSGKPVCKGGAPDTPMSYGNTDFTSSIRARSPNPLPRFED